jgi:CubicO group peptidase (beta-lactamase class C family)
MLLALLLVAAPASAQQPRQPSAYDRAIAAGYKALTLCSAIFIAGRNQADAEALELNGIYPEYEAIVPTLTAQVDRSRRTVSVAFDPAMPPRIASHFPLEGCTIHPIGAAAAPERRELMMVSSVIEPASRARWPTGDDNATARARGDQPALATAISGAMANLYGAGSRTTAIIVLQDGRIVGETYAPGFGVDTPQRTWSVAKSLSGTIIGIAVRRGLIQADQPAPIPEWQASGDPRGRITIDQLLRMASGLHSDTAGNRTDAVYFGGTAVTEETVGLPIEVPPGTRFRYANNDILLAMRALRARLPEGEQRAFPREMLFRRIGMQRTIAEADWRGNFILSSQVWSTARDLARVGLLWANDGVWQGERLLPEDWMAYMTRPSGPQPATGPGYGATMWLFGPAQGLPEGSYAAQGNRGQYVMVVPSRNIVVVRRGEDPTGARFDIASFTADVLAALR